MNSINIIKEKLRASGDSKKAKILQRFFKTKKGEYGEGDLFLGVSVPCSRKIAKEHADTGLSDLNKLLKSKFHEERLVALLILINKFEKGLEKEAVDFYLKNLRWINNWDLVDISAYKILGNYFFNRQRKILYNLAKSDNLWEKRIAIISTFYFIKNNDFNDTFKISEILLEDKHDLINKAVGWMLREVGKRDLRAEEDFIEKHHKKIHRTTLRYAIEKFPKEKKEYFLNK